MEIGRKRPKDRSYEIGTQNIKKKYPDHSEKTKTPLSTLEFT